MTITTPGRFLGATVTQFNSSMGWNDDVSRVDVSLVQDDINGDLFSPPDVGLPVSFNFHGWEFNGLLERWTQSNSAAGNPTFDVSIVDPRQLLDGVSVILDDYYGTANAPNVINAFGWLENAYGFGGSGKNDSGIPYLLLLQAILSIVNVVTPSAYGGNIVYKSAGYGIDVTNLPLIPQDYRVGGSTTMTLMDILRDICDAGGCEMFFRLVYINGYNIIKLYTISRINIPNFGTISSFINSTEGAVSKEIGFEMVNDTCAKMVFGGKKTMLYYQGFSGGEDDDVTTGYDNTIWPYWGHTINGRLVIADLMGYDHQFVLDARAVNLPNVGPWYPTSIGEIMAAMAGYGDWTTFLWLNWSFQYIPDPNGGITDTFWEIGRVVVVTNTGGTRMVMAPVRSARTYRHRGVLNPHFLKAYYIGLPSDVNLNLFSMMFGGELGDMENNQIYSTVSNDALTSQLHKLLLEYANEYYGRKYMVRVPNVRISRDPDTLKLSFSHLPTDSAWLESDTVEQAQRNNLLPLDFNGITDDSNKIYAFVRFDNVYLYNMDNIPTDSIFWANNGTSVFIRCEVDPEYVFLDGYVSPRVVVTLPGIVSYKNYDNLGPIWWMIFRGATYGLSSTNEDSDWFQQAQGSIFNLQSANSESVPAAITPNVAAIPLELQTELYGPWYIALSNGRTEVEHNDSLVPWNYGSTRLMNQAGEAQVLGVGVRLQSLEYGSVEYPGIPALQLGDQLLSSGPYVTDIRMSVSAQGVTTRYALKSWTPRYGKLAKYYADKFFKQKKTQFEFARKIREMRRRILK